MTNVKYTIKRCTDGKTKEFETNLTQEEIRSARKIFVPYDSFEKENVVKLKGRST